MNTFPPPRIALDPVDWFRATFRPRVPLVRGEPAPFDQARCLDRLASVRSVRGCRSTWRGLRIADALTREEAHFWLEAFLLPLQDRGYADPPGWWEAVGLLPDDPDLGLTAVDVARVLARPYRYGKLEPADVVRMLTSMRHRDVPERTVQMLAVLLPPDELLELVRARPERPELQAAAAMRERSLVCGFRRHVVPFLSAAEVADLQKPIRETWDPARMQVGTCRPLRGDAYLAACLGMHEEVASLTARWSDGQFARWSQEGYYHVPQDIVLGLGSAEAIVAEWRRLGLTLRNADQVRAFLACTEYAALDCVRASILLPQDRDTQAEMVAVLALVEAPEAAPEMLACKHGLRFPAVARAWFDRNPAAAVAGLIPLAAGDDPAAELAVEHLRDVGRAGGESLLAAGLAACGNEAWAARVRTRLETRPAPSIEPLPDADIPACLREPAGKRRRPLPSWAHPGLLPLLTIRGKRLPHEAVRNLLFRLACVALGDPAPELDGLRTMLDRPRLDDFLRCLFAAWAADGGLPTERWAFAALGRLGGDAIVFWLIPQLQVWPGESQHARAVFGLECLRAIGSDAALTHLAGMAQKLSFKGLKAKAEQFVEEIAAERGLTRAELEDRIVPDCGLDERGRREFSFGPRSFSFVLDGDLKPVLRDADGKLRGDLPKPNSKDDATLAEQATADWKLLKKQIRDVAALQATRLELAMTTGRRWSAADFERLLVGHPLLGHLVRKLVWGAYNATGTRVATFRTTEERDFADVKDNAVSLAGIDRVGIVHPLELSDAERSAWGEVLSDYELISPFPQLGRATYALEGSEADQTVLTRFDTVKLPAPTLVFGLEKLGWLRGAGLDAGYFTEHSKYFPAADLTVVVSYEGHVGMQWIDPNEMLQFAGCRFIPGKRKPSGYDEGFDAALRLGSLPPVVVSEVISDLQTLRSKSKAS